jgi:hypothetical protein
MDGSISCLSVGVVDIRWRDGGVIVLCWLRRVMLIAVTAVNLTLRTRYSAVVGVIRH